MAHKLMHSISFGDGPPMGLPRDKRDVSQLKMYVTFVDVYQAVRRTRLLGTFPLIDDIDDIGSVFTDFNNESDGETSPDPWR